MIKFTLTSPIYSGWSTNCIRPTVNCSLDDKLQIYNYFGQKNVIWTILRTATFCFCTASTGSPIWPQGGVTGWAVQTTNLGGDPEPRRAAGRKCLLFLTTIYLTNLQMINQLPQAHLTKIPAAFPLLSGSFSAKILGAIQLFYCLMLLLSHSPSIRISITALKYHWIVQAQLSRHDLVLVIKNTSYCVTALQAHSPSS